MTSADLSEIRALLRAEHDKPPAAAKSGRLRGWASWLRKPDLELARPRPVVARSAAEPSSWAVPASKAEGEPLALDCMTLDMFEPLALAPPKRAHFGLADGDRVAEPEMPPGPPQAELAFDPQETLVVCARRRHSPDPPVSTIGEAEILELQELLTERMPALLTQVDLVGKLSIEATQAHEEEPSIADVIAAVEAAREAAAQEVGIEAEAEAASQDCLAPFALNVSTVRFRPAPEDRSEKALLAQLHAHLEAEHTAFRAKIAALQKEFGLGQVAA